MAQATQLRSLTLQAEEAAGSAIGSEQYGPAIVEFRASWELSGERDLLSNLSWACERAGRIPEAKEYAVKYRDLSRGTEDAERSERRVKFLTERYPDGKSGDAKPSDGKPAEAMPPEAKPAPAPSAAQLTAQVVQSGDATPSNGSTPGGRPLAIGLVAGGGATLVLAIGLGAGAIATWAEADRSETYYDRWLSLNTTSRALTISAAISGVTGVSLLGAFHLTCLPCNRRRHSLLVDGDFNRPTEASRAADRHAPYRWRFQRLCARLLS